MKLHFWVEWTTSNYGRFTTLPSFFSFRLYTKNLVFVEAMSCGLPVIISKTGALPELAGGAGVLVDPNDPVAMAEAPYQMSEGFGDAYLITDPGMIFFPHDFYHPLVNWYMARNTAGADGPQKQPCAPRLPWSSAG